MSRRRGSTPETSKHIQAFEAWYACEKNFDKARHLLAASTPPLVISKDTIYRWRDAYNWDGRAGERDEAVAKERAEKAVKAQVEFLNRKANYGKLLQKRAIEYFKDVVDANGKPIPKDYVTSAAVGVQVLQAGVQLEQSAMGLPEWITEILSADEQTLRRVYDTALKELASATNFDADEGDKDATFPAVQIKPIQQDS